MWSDCLTPFTLVSESIVLLVCVIHILNTSPLYVQSIISFINDRVPSDPNDERFEEFLNLKHLEELMKLFQATDDVAEADGVFNRCVFVRRSPQLFISIN